MEHRRRPGRTDTIHQRKRFWNSPLEKTRNTGTGWPVRLSIDSGYRDCAKQQKLQRGDGRK